MSLHLSSASFFLSQFIRNKCYNYIILITIYYRRIYFYSAFKMTWSQIHFAPFTIMTDISQYWGNTRFPKHFFCLAVLIIIDLFNCLRVYIVCICVCMCNVLTMLSDTEGLYNYKGYANCSLGLSVSLSQY